MLHSAPALRSLRIHSTLQHTLWMSSDFLVDGPPLLEALDILYLSHHWRWEHPIFTHLKVLKVHSTRWILYQLEVEASNLLGALERSPRLETLVLRGVIPVLCPRTLGLEAAEQLGALLESLGILPNAGAPSTPSCLDTTGTHCVTNSSISSTVTVSLVDSVSSVG
jgi:hypothetical protein